MKIVPYKTKEHWLDPFEQLEDDSISMNRLFDFNFPKPFNRAGKGDYLWAPAVDITDDKDSITVKAEIPGLTKDQIEVLVRHGVLTIKGEKKQEKETKEKDYVRSERFYGSFYRAFDLPVDIDSQHVKATYKDGVLEILLPKKEGASPKQVKIEVK